jgi:uncharacterized membrane protein HdeD (DUF308 family)
MAKKSIIEYFFKNMATIIGVVLVWRGIWYILDGLDKIVFNGSHVLSSIIGIVVGLLILYIPDKDLKEIGNL